MEVRNERSNRGEMSLDEIIWSPSPEYQASSRLAIFMKRVGVDGLPSLLRRAEDDCGWFWDAVVKDLDLEFYRPYQQVVDLSGGFAWAKWFRGGLFNYVHNAVDKHAFSEHGDRLALAWEGEDGEVRKYTFRDLHGEVCRCANALRSLGVNKGDRVGIFLPMIPEVVISTLACGKIGAVFTPAFSGYGAQAVASRLRDCEAKVLITVDSFFRRGGRVLMKETADAAADLTPSIEKVVVVRRMGAEIPWIEGRDVWWHDLMLGQSGLCETEPTDPENPYMLIYTSGTTGRPKGALHVQAGFPVKSAQDMAHCFDVRESDVMFWFTDIGWMMGPWVIQGTLMLGAALFIYEGSPDYPRPDRLWEMIERHRVSIFGFSPTGVRSLMSHGEDWVRKHDLGSLRILGSTGEPWNEKPYMWFFENVGGGRCPIINYSGGTEISGGILGCNVITPLKPCSFSGPVPGMSADVVDDDCRPVRGQVGELVIRQPWVGMTRGFWKDSARYEETYWSRWPGVWAHGDWAMIDRDGFWFILGRSDDTIKIAGKRLGPAEMETAAVADPAVAEAAAIGVPDELKGEVAICFVVLKKGFAESEAVRSQIMNTLVEHLGKAYRPEAVRFVSDVPKTRNGKIMRRLLRAKYLGLEIGDLSALENPAALEEASRSR